MGSTGKGGRSVDKGRFGVGVGDVSGGVRKRILSQVRMGQGGCQGQVQGQGQGQGQGQLHWNQGYQGGEGATTDASPEARWSE